MSPIGQTRTDAQGRYTLSVDRPALASWYGNKLGGHVQVEVSATAPGFFASFDATVDYHPSQGAVELVPAEGVSVADRPQNRRGAQPLDLTLSVAEGAPSDVAMLQHADGDPMTAAVIGYSCFQYKADLGRIRATIGQVSAQTTSYVANYTYTSGVSNTLGAGTSASGAYGTFTASGTRTVSSGTTLGFPGASNTGTANFRTEVRYGKYYGTGCSPSNVFYYKAYPSEWIGGVIVETISTSPGATYCATVNNGGSLTQNRSTSTTVSAGVSSAGAIGINLTSQAGWTNSSALKITMRKNGSVCGVSGYPASTTSNPGRLVVK